MWMLLVTCALAAAALLTRPSGSLAASVKGIKVDINVPREAELGHSADLKCSWKLTGNSTLYSVKWYKDDYEFFSYNPENGPLDRIKTHQQNGVAVDLKHSDKNTIRLMDLGLNSSGQYKCDVSTGPPTFATNYLQSNLTVIALPTQGPEITGLLTHYAPGENVTANCTAWPSVPKAQLYWIINNRTVPASYIVQHAPHAPIQSQGTPSTLGLRFEMELRHLQAGSNLLRVRCVAHVGSRRFETERHVQLAHANNQRFSAGDTRSGASATARSAIFYDSATLLLVCLASMLGT